MKLKLFVILIMSFSFTGLNLFAQSVDNDGLYEICTCADLQQIQTNLAEGYELNNSIDCSITNILNYDSTTGFYNGF